MKAEKNLTRIIDTKNFQFSDSVNSRLNNLTAYPESALEWLMVEHYQFSKINPVFLKQAAKTTLNNQLINAELMRNYNEEKNHAVIYKKGLFEIGTDVLQRQEFSATTTFFAKLSQLIANCPYETLGAMYATETAAIFEHTIFLAISEVVVSRRPHIYWPKTRLKAFHDMHLNGVEQAHKDELGQFVNDTTLTETKINKIIVGANAAIAAMAMWWDALISYTMKLHYQN